MVVYGVLRGGVLHRLFKSSEDAENTADTLNKMFPNQRTLYVVVPLNVN